MHKSPIHLLKERYQMVNAIDQRKIREAFAKEFKSSNDVSFYNLINHRVDFRVSHLLFFAKALNEPNPMCLINPSLINN